MIKKIMGSPASAMSFHSLNGIYKKSNNCHPKGGRMMLFIAKPQTKLTNLGMAHITKNSCDIFEPYHTANYSRFRDLNLPCFPISKSTVKNASLFLFWELKKQAQKSRRTEKGYSNTTLLSQNETFPLLSPSPITGISYA